jgi:hypothetical protein
MPRSLNRQLRGSYDEPKRETDDDPEASEE